METSIQEKETTLKLIDNHLDLLSKLYKECYLQKGRGALILYPFHVENIPQLSCIDYNTRNQSLDLSISIGQVLFILILFDHFII